MNRITLDVNRSKGTINKNIYGHFSEHLGRCIYQGLYVGEESNIPNVKGMRTDGLDYLVDFLLYFGEEAFMDSKGIAFAFMLFIMDCVLHKRSFSALLN